MHARIGIFGASGYAGMEAAKLLAAHPRAQLSFLSSDRRAGEGARGLAYVSHAEAETLAEECDAVLLAMPAEASLELVPRLLRRRLRVIDLSGAFRIADSELYPRFYGFNHGHPGLLAEAVYGLPEENRARIAGARFVANPGCYPTASALALAPLLRAKLIEPDGIVIDAASGVTGAGRKANEDFSFAEIDGDFRAYKVFKHQHAPEIAQSLSTAFGASVRLTFTPHLLPVRRGILVTAHARLARGADGRSLHAALADAYGHERFVRLAKSPDDVALKHVVGTNDCRLGVAADEECVIVTAAIDNLLKGAAGQAVQNLNLMMGWGETEGLPG